MAPASGIEDRIRIAACISTIVTGSGTAWGARVVLLRGFSTLRTSSCGRVSNSKMT